MVFRSLAGGESWSGVSADGIDGNAMVYVVSESALQDGMVTVSQTDSFLMTSDSRRACGKLPLAGERPQETFPVAIATARSAGRSCYRWVQRLPTVSSPGCTFQAGKVGGRYPPFQLT